MTLTPKQEEFCRVYVETGNASEAYRRAYDCDRMKPATINRKATELMQNGTITARLGKLQAEAAERSEVSVDRHLAMLAIIRDQAMADGKYGAAVSAEVSRGKLCGFYTDRVHHSMEPDISTMTEEEVERELAELERRREVAKAVTGPGERRVEL